MPAERDDSGRRGGAVFVLPTATAGQQGPVAGWMSTAGWANATRRVLGNAWIVTPHGLVDPEEVRRAGSRPSLAPPAGPTWRRYVPDHAKTLAKDVRRWRQARGFRIGRDGPWGGNDVAFVWQRHELFHTAGRDLARQLGVPSVLFVPAALVWEAKQWSVHRPGWSWLVERAGEAPALRGADLVACGADLVAEQVARIGVREERILVTPTGVDLDEFAPDRAGTDRRAELGLAGRFVVGWVGSFRRFHALEQAVAAVRDLPDATLLLVGDGPERERIERRARAEGVDVVATGTVHHADLPGYLEAMDVALVLAPPGQPFHYSPLKLAEYLAAGRAVVAPRTAQIAERLCDGRDALLVAPGDGAAVTAAVRRLYRDPALRERIGTAARAAAVGRWSWDRQVGRVLEALGRHAP